jgi:hypothetical protein
MPTRFFDLLERTDFMVFSTEASTVIEHALKTFSKQYCCEIYFVDQTESPLYFTVLFRKIVECIPFINRLPILVAAEMFADVAGIIARPIDPEAKAETVQAAVETIVNDLHGLDGVMVMKNDTFRVTRGDLALDISFMSRQKATLEYIEAFERDMKEQPKDDSYPYIAVIEAASEIFDTVREELSYDKELRRFFDENFDEVGSPMGVPKLLTLAFRRRAERDQTVAVILGKEPGKAAEALQSISVH